MCPMNPDTESSAVSSLIEAGDKAAADGEWVQAIALWEQVLDSPQRHVATGRIRWMLANTGDAPADHVDEIGHGNSRVRLLAAAVACAAVGTACVFLGQHQTGAMRNVLASAAWALYIVTAALVVAYAFGRRPSREASTPPDLTDVELGNARQVAARLSPGSGSRQQPA